MTVTDVRKDPERLTMTVTCELAAGVDRAWQLWADARQLEQWWGPPTYPATFTHLDLRPGGEAKYHMTGPEGDVSRGWWRIRTAEPMRLIEMDDGFADPDGNPNAGMPTMQMRVTFADAGEQRTRMAIETTFPSLEAMEQLIEMGMEEGLAAAMGQIDSVLATSV